MKCVFGWTRNQIILWLGAFLLTLLCILLFNRAPSQAQNQITTNQLSQEITEGWHYYWGNIPQNEFGIPRLTEEEIAQLDWQPFQFPARLENNQGETIVWLRVPLPGGQWNSSHLYLRAIPHILNAYLGKKQIYSQLSLNSNGEAYYKDYQWPIIPLEPNYANKTLLFQVYAGNSSIYMGLFDRVTIGNQTDLIKQLFLQFSDAILAAFFIFLGLIACALSFQRQEKKAYCYFGVTAILIGLYTLTRSAVVVFLLKNLWNIRLIEYTSLYLIPVGTSLFFEKIFGPGYKGIIRRLWQFNLTYAIIALALIIVHTQNAFTFTLYGAQFLLLISAITVLVRAIKIALKGSCDAKLFMLGIIILSISVINDVLIYRLGSIYSWYHKLYPWGTFVFILILGLILERRFAEARQKLQIYALELEQKNAELQKLDQLKDEFLANTSHELKTPLNGIIGIAESLIDGVTGQLPQQTVFNLSLIASSGRRLTQLVNDLLDFSQLKYKQVVLNIKPVGLREITEVVLRLSSPLICHKSLHLVNKIGSDIPPVDADENRLQQILYNLVGNAIKFTSNGTIEVSARVINNQVEITVADTGIGIPTDKLDRIFKSFEQADGSIARKYGGVGLGLAVTKELVHLHGGEVGVESTVGVGSRFTFTLPLSKSKVEGHQQKDISPIQDFARISLTPDIVLTDRETLTPHEGAFKILIVDDEPINLQVLVNHLSLQNYAITQASTGMEALEVIRQGFKPDLILLDVMMPQMTGYELCQKIREQFPANVLPVVLLTVKNQVSDLVEGFNAGANDYLTKPVSKNELLARIKTHIQLAKINVAYGRFVPYEFLRFLERESIIDVQLGDQVQKEMTVIFADIRSFTTLSEKMTPKENFDFLNTCLGEISPVIRDHNGFIDKYLGDGIMALFPRTADDAVQAAVEMQKKVALYNFHWQQSGNEPVAIGIGMHTGTLMLGTVGELQRMETTVIADAVNLASRLEGLTKFYGVKILISEQTLYRLDNPQNYHYRFLGRVTVKGKSQPVDVFEVYDNDPQDLIELKQQTRAEFEQAVALFIEENFEQAQQTFQQVLQTNNQDRVVQLYIERCQKAQRLGLSERDIVMN